MMVSIGDMVAARGPALRQGCHLAGGWVEHEVHPCAGGFEDDEAPAILGDEAGD
jgi:hypothetical protein